MGIHETPSTDVQPIDLVAIEGEARGRDADLAKRLGFKTPAMIRKLIKRHAAALSHFGVISTVEKTSGAAGGRPSVEYWLNEGQALYIGAKSDAPNASAVLTMLIEVFMRWRRGQLEPVEPLNARDTGGILKKVLGKHSREVILPGVHDELVALVRTLTEIVKQDARLIAATHVSIRTILDDMRIASHGRRSLQGKITHRLRKHFEMAGIDPRKCELSRVLLWPRAETETYIANHCSDLIRRHREALDRQTSLDLQITKATTSTLPN